jgi:hypothetical protein
MAKVNWKAKHNFEILNNFKILNKAFKKLRIEKLIDFNNLLSFDY